MTPYVISEGIFTEAHLEARDIAEGFMADLPDPEVGAPACRSVQRGKDEMKTYWSCHGLVRAFAKLHPGWIVLDGYFGVLKHQHSWLLQYTAEDGGAVILDLYPVGAGMPMIVDASPRSPWRALYVESTIAYRPTERELWEKEAEYALSLYRRVQESEKDPPPRTVVEFPSPPATTLPLPDDTGPIPEFQVPRTAPQPPVSIAPRPPIGKLDDRPPSLRDAFVPLPEVRRPPLVGSPVQAPQAAQKPVFSPPPPMPRAAVQVEEPKRRFRLQGIVDHVNDFLDRQRHRVGG